MRNLYNLLKTSTASLVMMMLFLFFADTGTVEAQNCSTAFTTVGTLTPTTVWQNTTAAAGNRRRWTFAATAGNVYDFSTCNSTGGNDTYIRIHRTNVFNTLEIGYDDNGPFCSPSSYASGSWTCPTTGTYAVWVTNYLCNTLSVNTILSYRFSTPAPYNGCASVTNIATCGTTVNSSTASGNGVLSPGNCGFATPGKEKIFTFTPPTTGSYNIQQFSSFNFIDYFWKPVSGGCNGTGWTCFDDLFGAATSVTPATLTGGVQYYIMADPEVSTGGNFSFQVTCAVVTYNPCTSITNIPACATPVASTIAAGTGAYDPPAGTCGFNTPGQEKIFTFTPPTTGSYNIQQLSSFAYIDYFWKPVSGGCNGTGWTCFDDLNGPATSGTPATLTGGVQYYIMADPEVSTGGNFSFQMVCPGPPPANDNCAGATLITSNLVCSNTTFNTTNATASGGAVTCGGNADDDIWFRFVAVGTTSTINMAYTALNPIYEVYSSCGGPSIGCRDVLFGGATLDVTTTPGLTYYIRVYSFGAGSSATNTNICVTHTIPFNPCVGITNIATCGSTVNATIAAGTGAYNPPAGTCGFNTPGQEELFTFTPASTGVYNIQQLTSFAFIDYFWKPVSGGCNGTGWTCFDDLTGAATSGAPATLTGGVQYYIMADPEGSGGGNFSFQVVCPPPPPPSNDACGTPVNLIVGNPPVAGDNTGATPETPLPAAGTCGVLAPTVTSKGMWYTFTTGCAGNYTLTLAPGATFDGDFAAFTGACGATTNVGCDGDGGAGVIESITITGAPASTLYRILVWGYLGSTGTFTIAVTGPSASLSLSNTGTPAAGFIPAGTTNQVLHGFTLTPTCGLASYNFTNVVITNTGSANSGDFSSLGKLYYDANSNGAWDGGDVLVGSTTISGSMNIAVATQTGITVARQYILVADIATNATGGNTFVASGTTPTANVAVTGTATGNTRTISPINDNCAGAIAFGTLVTGCTTQTVNTGGTTTSPGTVTCGGGNQDDDVWYSFVIPAGYTSVSYSMVTLTGNTDHFIQILNTNCAGGEAYCSTLESANVTLAPGTYYIRTFTAGTNSTYDLCLTLPPANNDCAGVIAFPALAPGCTNVNANTLGATASGQATVCGTPDDDIWYSFVLPGGYSSFSYSMTDISGDANRSIQFFNSSCGVGSIGCTSTPSGSYSSLAPGTYWARVYTTGSGTSSNFTLCIALPPTNDDCAGAIPFPALQPGCTIVGVSTAASTPSGGVVPCVGTPDDDVWYSFVLPVGNTTIGYSMTNVSGNTDRVFQLYSSCGVAVGLPNACGTAESNTITGLTAGATYYVRVFTFGADVYSDFDLCIALPPANDLACNAEALSSPEACLPTLGTTQLATPSQGTNGVPLACAGSADDDVWYSFVATSQSHTVTVTGSAGFNAVTELYTRAGGCPGATYTLIAGTCTNLTGAGGIESTTIRTLTIGTTYYVRVYDFATGASASPTFTICVVENPTGVPIIYYDFELNSSRNNTTEVSAEVSVNTPSNITSTGGTAFVQSGAGVTSGNVVPNYGASITCLPTTSGTTTLTPTNYLEVGLNSSGFKTLSLDFDLFSYNDGISWPDIAVNISTNGGTTWSVLADIPLPSILDSDVWLSLANPIILPASCNNNPNIKLRFYGYNSLGFGDLSIDNLTLFAASTVAGAGTKTLVSFPVVYTGVTSGLTGSLYVYDKFTALGAGTTVNMTASNMALFNQFNVTTSGTFNFGTGVAPTYLLSGGAAAANVNTLGTIGITDAAGITSSGATGNIQSTGVRTFGTDGSYTYMDDAAQVTGNGLPATVNNLTIDNTSGVTLTGTGVTVNGVLGLTNGILRTAIFATHNITIGAAGSVSRTNGWVYGNLNKRVIAGNPTLGYEVGNLTNYNPVSLTFSAVTTPGYFSSRAISPSDNSGSCLNNVQKVNSYWALVNTSVAPANYQATFNYVPAEVVGAPTNFVVGKFDGGVWTYPTVSGTPTNNNIDISNGSGSGEYHIGDGVVPSVTIGVSPAGTTCAGSPLTFTASPINGGTPNYEFFVNGVSMQNGTSATFISSSVANGQNVSVTMTSTAGCITTSTATSPTPVTVSRNPSPLLSASNPPAVCTPATVSLVGLATDANGVTGTFSYYATLANAEAGTGAISPTVSTSGTYYIRKTATSGGCFDIASVVVVIYQSPSLTITNPLPTCNGGSVDITANGIVIDNNSTTGTLSYFSTLADANSNINPLASPNFVAVGGTYYIRKTTSDGCYDVEPVVVTFQTCGVVTWEGDISTDWHTAGNWNLNYVPTSTDDIIIPNVTNDPIVSTADGNGKNLQINAGAIITITSPNSLIVKGNWSGAANIISGTGQTAFQSSFAQTITGGATFSTLQINNAFGITIEPGAPKVRVTTALELKTGQLTTNGNLVTVSTALTTAYIDDFSPTFAGSLSGNVAVERYITNGPNGYRYIGAPVATTAGGSTLNLSALSGFVISGTPGQLIPLPTCNPNNSAQNSPYSTFMRWEEAGPFLYNCRQSGWWFQTTGTMTIGRGYGAKVSSGTKITYTGAANTGAISYGPLANSGPIGNGWHLVSNPFPSSMAISNIDGNANNNMPAGFNGQIQLYITSGPYTGSYLAYNTGLVTAPFALGQGFWVQSTGSGTFTVNNNYRVTNQVNYYDVNSDIQHHLNVNVAGNGFMDKTDIYFLPTAQTGFDFYDAEKWESRSDQPTLYTKVGSQSTAINSLPSLQETVVVPMGVKPGTNGNYTFTFDDIATFPQTSMIYLEDLQLGTMNNLRENNTYSFTANVNDNADRFMLHFQPGLQAEVADQDCDNAGSIELTQPAPTIWSTYEVRGNDNNVYAQGTDFTGNTTITNLPPQEYVVTVTHASGYSAQEYITVNGNSPVNATINASATNVMVDEMVSLTGTATDATEYVWNFGDGNTQSGSSTVVHAYDAEGVYTVSMTASNSTCNDVASKVINVTKTTTGINGTEATNVKIYGQGERVVIEFNNWGGNKADIFMYNALGQRVESLTGVSTLKGRQDLYIADIIPGTYFIQVVSDGKIQGKKVFLGKH